MPDFYEFFAGGGMARAGLGKHWHCLFANDFDAMKAKAYRENWGSGDLVERDVNLVDSQKDLPGVPDLAWASFPCQDLSLAGNSAGLGHRSAKLQTRSGTFWPFWNLMRSLASEGRAPKLIVLENVYGTLTSHSGKDFSAIASSLSGGGYRFGAMVIDARHFLPQSRPRLFIVAVRRDLEIPTHLVAKEPIDPWHPKAMREAVNMLSGEARKKWLWWNLQMPSPRRNVFADLIEAQPTGVDWHTTAETKRLLGMMSELNLAKVREAKRAGRPMVGGVYRRTRADEDGVKTQRAEVRFDDVAGCLRTPGGGSSRQSILIVDGQKVRSRLISPREAARLMGLPDSYKLPESYNDAYHIAGDGVAVPVVRYLANQILEPILVAANSTYELAAAVG